MPLQALQKQAVEDVESCWDSASSSYSQVAGAVEEDLEAYFGRFLAIPPRHVPSYPSGRLLVIPFLVTLQASSRHTPSAGFSSYPFGRLLVIPLGAPSRHRSSSYPLSWPVGMRKTRQPTS